MKNNHRHQKNGFNSTLKLTHRELESQMWKYYMTLPKEERSKLGNLLGHPTCSSLKRWYKFWGSKIEMLDIHREYFEFVLDKLESYK